MELSRHSSCKLISGSCFLPNPWLDLCITVRDPLGNAVFEALLSLARTGEAELPIPGSQAELGNQPNCMNCMTMKIIWTGIHRMRVNDDCA